MNVLEDLKLLNILRIIMSSGIILTYGFSFYWGIMFIVKTKWQNYSWLKIYNAVASLLMAVLYTYYLISFITGSPIEITIMGLLAVRPIILLMGGSLASNARARYIALKYGGEHWTLLK